MMLLPPRSLPAGPPGPAAVDAAWRRPYAGAAQAAERSRLGPRATPHRADWLHSYIAGATGDFHGALSGATRVVRDVSGRSGSPASLRVAALFTGGAALRQMRRYDEAERFDR